MAKTHRQVLEECYQKASQCSDHPDSVPWKLADVKLVLWAESWCGHYGWSVELSDYDDSGSAAIVLLTDGRYGTVTENSDSSGHG